MRDGQGADVVHSTSAPHAALDLPIVGLAVVAIDEANAGGTSLMVRALIMVTVLACLALPLAPGLRMASAGSPKDFELLHLWLAKSEASALDVIKTTIQRSGLTWLEHRANGNFDGVRLKLAERLTFNIPPTAVFWIGGQGADEFVKAGIARSIPKDAGKMSGMAATYIPSIQRLIEFDGGYTGIPLSIHTQNHVTYNRKVYGDLHIPFPSSWTEFLADAPKFKSSGIVPLAMSSQRWQLRFLFFSILVEYVRPELLEMLLSDAPQNSDELRNGLISCLNVLRALQGFVNKDNEDMEWVDVVDLVKTSRAAAMVLGDFTSSAFDDESKFACGLPSGNKYILWSFDMLVFPTQSKVEDWENQGIGIDALRSRDFIAQYTAAKGGLPTFEGAEPSSLNYCSRQVWQMWEAGVPKVHVGTRAWRKQFNLISGLAVEFWLNKTRSAEDTANLMISALAQ